MGCWWDVGCLWLAMIIMFLIISRFYVIISLLSYGLSQLIPFLLCLVGESLLCLYTFLFFLCIFWFLARVHFFSDEWEEVAHVICRYISVYDLLWGGPKILLCYRSFYLWSGSGLCYNNSEGVYNVGVVGGEGLSQLI